MNNNPSPAQIASKQLDNHSISKECFLSLYDTWKDSSFDWRVHLSLIMHPQIENDRFVYLARKFSDHEIMREETLAQIGKLTDLDIDVKKALLTSFLPLADKTQSEWKLLERIAMSKI